MADTDGKRAPLDKETWCGCLAQNREYSKAYNILEVPLPSSLVDGVLDAEGGKETSVGCQSAT